MVRGLVFVGALALNPGIAAAQTNTGDQQTAIHSPWTKMCMKATEGIQTCYTTITLRTPCSQIGSASLISKNGEPNILQVTVAWRASRGFRTQITIDNGTSRTEPLATCIGDAGCTSRYVADVDLLNRLKQGSTMLVEELGGEKQVRFTLPLAGFTEALDGPEFDPRAVKVPVEDLRRELADRPLAGCLNVQ